ncbi:MULTISPECIES: carbon-nitrogen hydrolase family protein [unclassified Hwanghaeella]|jgi:predicted amidohydrolase|uniref:carbon-nitrogen hydrolase family protein n=1 Tax=unclassified Hwanghaeella TaxID=2605944 RepID=UPI000C89B111|nr:amidohydrolase [Rhodospirillales bacterium]|tara:strand:+ start:2926 stop:3783 length:858 start_codon:yes stop_codon:yes gene_type:complete
MKETLTVGLVQMTSTTSIDQNIKISSDLIRQAAAQGSELVALPEVVNLMQRDRSQSSKVAALDSEDASLAAYKALAQELGIWIHAGSLVIRLADDDRFANRGFLIDPTGLIQAQYDKIHMFDVDLANGESYRESNGFRPGTHATLAQTPWGGYGMAVCYDLRFPHLFRDLAKAGARILAVPAAFTRTTGQAHWHTLLRARAIENGCFVVAPAQCGDHEDGRKTYGHALIIDPWGEVLADGGEAPGVVTATLNLNRVSEVRGMVPSLNNDLPYDKPQEVALNAAAE